VNLQFAVAEHAASKPRAERQVEEVVGDGFDVRKFTENFDVLVNTAGSTKHLKELVLKLAFRGGLSLASDETADALLVELRRERLKLAKTGIRIGEDSPPVADEEAPYAIPPGWRWIRLRDLGGFLGGGTPAKSNAAFWKGPLPWVSPKDMKRPYIEDAEDHISVAAVEGSAVKLIPAQSILYVVRGMILAHSFPVAIATREVTINQDMKAMVLAIPALSEFVLRSCQAARTRVLAKVERSSHGTCRLESEAVETLPIALPPLAEQGRIVARVDQLMALIDDLEAKQTRKREVSARFTKASLEALTTAEGPEEFDSSSRRLVENLGVVAGSSADMEDLKRYIVRIATSGGGVAGGQPDERMVTTVGEVAECLDSLRKPVRKDLRNVGGGKEQYPYFGANGQVGWIDSYIFDEPLVCVVEDETFVGRKKPFAYRVDGKCWVNNHAHVLRAGPEVSVDYLHLALAFYPFDTVASGTTGRKKLTKAELLRTPLRIPSAKRQQTIVSMVRSLLGLCEDLEAKLRRAEDRASKLVEAVVQEIVA
jgi:type I restriction enzyme S subunit